MKSSTDCAEEQQAEELARAEWYGLLAALFYAAPQSSMLSELRGAADAEQQQRKAPDGELAKAFSALLECVRGMTAAEVAAEYDALFGGVGKPDVYLFGSHYLSGFLNEKPLVQLRDDLAQLGIARADQINETEDHIAWLLDAMRHLIVEPAGQGGARLKQQQLLFERHIAPWFEALCDTVLRHPKARFHARLAELSRVFLAIERQAFEMLESDNEQ